ncbi:hypothetical protein EI427_13535 [Flammeovirga pectinis]|uniref:OmpA-like domain-containing protein n=1 Tax=Flammeovirga pectinis TaxID=2494373 RepID=A0A3Q9FS31_9BACT|nr:OmpA family protein [Flammeovirga pectinis]AZQ63226.1 hypothetical protein EI427_13535 [Flammeovirga pectinis]
MRFTHLLTKNPLCYFLLFISSITLAENNEFTLKGLYLDSKTGNTVEGVKVCVENTKSGAKTTIYTDQEGKFVITLNDESDFTVHGTKPKYFDQLIHSFSTVGLSTEEEIDVTYTIDEVRLNETYVFSNLEFEINSHYKINNGEEHIQVLSDLMKEFSNIKVTVKVHSDSRGSDEYNKEVTQRRADYIKELLMAEKILASNIFAEGIGEDELINKCDNGVKCSNSMHLQNRRVEFILESI